MKHRLLLLIAAISVIAAACSSSSDVSDSATTSSVAPQTTTTTEAPATTTTSATTTTQALPAERTFTGVDGVETVISDISAIVSLTGDLTEIIFELGLGSNVVGVDVTTTYPPEAAAMNEQGNTVGFAQQLTPEAVLRFNPSLVIGDQTIAPQETIDQLRAAGIPVIILESRTTLDGALAKIGDVAEILDVPDAGTELILRVGNEIDAATTLANSAPDQPTIAYIYTRGPQLVLLFGLGMPTQAMIEGANAIDAGVTSGILGPAPVTPEALIAAAPDVIVLPEAGIAAMGGLEAFKEVPGIADTPAGQTDSFLIYDEAYFFNLGPRVGLALTDFVNDLYPDLGG
ncbi:MAG: hemin ABC transporter substrate-binding protein [Acidimicrobiia bacterium]|nr:MAG: hemin ABC transporter substrate-binding protein [Acidimicrobiia bacterium]